MIAGSKLVAKLQGNFGQQLCRQGWFNRPVPNFLCLEMTWKQDASVKPSHAEHRGCVAGEDAGKGASSCPATCRAGAVGRGSLCASLHPTRRQALQIPVLTGIIVPGNPAFKSRGVVPAYLSWHLAGLQALKNSLLSDKIPACLRIGNNGPWRNLFCNGDETGLLND